MLQAEGCEDAFGDVPLGTARVDAGRLDSGLLRELLRLLVLGRQCHPYSRCCVEVRVTGQGVVRVMCFVNIKILLEQH